MLNLTSISHSEREFCKRILPEVSRTFAINIAILKGPLYWDILCSYLFCRIVDTIEDSEHLSFEQQKELLDLYIQIFEQDKVELSNLEKIKNHFKSFNPEHPDHILISHAEKPFTLYEQFSGSSQEAIKACVIEMAQGMKQTLENKEKTAEHKLHSLQSLQDLDEYCYYVAGTVGVMLTKLFKNASTNISTLQYERMQGLEVSFGLGLQITNIIKDSFKDRKRGWSYIPEDLAKKHGLSIAGFLDQNKRAEALCCLKDLISKAQHHLDDALEYSLLIPARERRMRLFCLWPLFFAVATLHKARKHTEQLLTEEPLKISRKNVKSLMLKTSLNWWNDRALRKLYQNYSIG